MIRITPIATAQIPATVMSAARVAPGSASARTPSATSARPRRSSSHQSGTMRRAANAPVMVIVPITTSHAPRMIATASRPGDGQTMITTPAAMDSRPVTTFARRTRRSMPVVSASIAPWKMKSAPMNVARLLIVQSMLKIRKPATTRSAPLRRSTHQFRAISLAAWRVSL